MSYTMETAECMFWCFYKVIEYIPHVEFENYYLTFSKLDLQGYMYQLLSRVHEMHINRIMHRDIKPLNIFYNPKTKKLCLGDFGLSEEFYTENTLSTNISNRYFKSPELLLDIQFYHFAIDIWAIGVIFASIVIL